MTESALAYFKRLGVSRTRRVALRPSTYRYRLRWPAQGTVITIGAALVGLQALTLGQWIADDAGVTFAYARSIGEGLGPVQQPGAAPVEGYSDPAWLALLVLGRMVGLFDNGSWFGVSDLVTFPKFLALLCVVGMLAVVASVARVVLPRRANAVTMIAGLLMAANFSLIAWMFSGLENPLTALAVTLLTAVLVKGVARGRLLGPRVAGAAALAALLAALNRPDGVIYAAAYPLTVLLFVGGTAVSASVAAVRRYGLIFAVPFGGFLLWRRMEFGMWLPNSAVAKSQSAPSMADLSHTGDLMAWAGWGLVLPVAACVGIVAARRRPVRARLTDPADAVPFGPALSAALVPLALALLAYGILKPDGQALASLRLWAQTTIDRLDRTWRADGRGGCGAQLRVGQTL
ncbi:hypothetical protein ABH926_004529 [Catenulispora sp. GP43]|uniref:hypothetical protein n=1 Tax=Catenulispora sp. GP43 TaxID=3156263 RepID=UPI0035156AED